MNYKKKLKIVRKYEPKMDDAGWISIKGWRLKVDGWRLKVEKDWRRSKVKINKCKRLKIIEGERKKSK